MLIAKFRNPFTRCDQNVEQNDWASEGLDPRLTLLGGNGEFDKLCHHATPGYEYGQSALHMSPSATDTARN